MVRTASVDENGMKKGTWSQEEDDKLRSYILRYGHWNWRKLPKFAGLSRCGKSCRLRWMNYLRPDVKRGNFSEVEDDLIIQMHQELGNKWSRIAMKLPGRTDNDIKNHWHTHLKQREKRKTQATPEMTKKDQPSETPQSAAKIPSENLEVETAVSSDAPSHPMIFESFPFSKESCDYSSAWAGGNWVAENCSMGMFEDCAEDFWTQPFAADNDDNYNGDGYILSYDSYYNDDLEFIL